jgi:hypothetical protein
MRKKIPVKELKAITAKVVKDDAWKWMFDACVLFLALLANALDPVWPGGMDYVKVNVILFCILLPIILVGSLALNVCLLWTR